MNILLITQSNMWCGYGVAAFCLLFGISVLVWAVRTVGCFEHESDPVSYEPVTYDEIVKNEKLCIDFINN